MGHPPVAEESLY